MINEVSAEQVLGAVAILIGVIVIDWIHKGL
jgi:hypothetical protein